MPVERNIQRTSLVLDIAGIMTSVIVSEVGSRFSTRKKRQHGIKMRSASIERPSNPIVDDLIELGVWTTVRGLQAARTVNRIGQTLASRLRR